MKKIFWFIIDSVRSIRTNKDDRDRLEIMDKLDHEFANYQNAYTSAPSTIMSAASMFTGNNTFKMSRSYSDWKFDSKTITPLKKILEERDYEIFPIDNSKRAREMLKSIIGYLDKKFYPSLSHGKNWSNQEVTAIFENCLKKSDKNKNSFFMCWFDCRHDKYSSNEIEKCLKLIKDNGFYDDAIIIINSDHGYPDPSATSPAKLNLPHDLVITEDNIKVPLLVKAPNLENGKKNYNVMLLDLFKTILDYCNISDKYNHDGISLFENQKLFQNRILRVDTRLLLQNGKVTALIKDRFKFVYYHDSKRSELYDLNKDNLELYNISSNNKDLTNNFFKFFNNQQNELIEIHQKKLRENLKKSLGELKLDKIKEVYICTNLNEFSLNILISLIKNQNNRIYLITKNKISNELNNKFNEIYLLDTKQNTKNIVNLKKELLIILEEKNYYRILDRNIFNTFKSIKADNRIVIDTNFQKINLFFSKWFYPLLKYKQNWIFYKKEPSLLITDFFKLFFLMIREYFLKKEVFTPRMEDVKLARDTSIKSQSLNLIVVHKISILYSGFSRFGGTQIQVEKFINTKPDRMEIDVFSLSKEDLSREQNLYNYQSSTDKSQVSNIFYNKIIDKENKPIFNYKLYKLLRDQVKKFKILSVITRFVKAVTYFKKDTREIIYISFLTFNNLNLLLLKIFGRFNTNSKYIINERNNFVEETKNNLFLRIFYVFLIKLTNPVVLTNSMITKKYFEKKNIKSTLTYNYLPKRIILNNERIQKIISCKHYINVGRYTGQKDQMGLINLLKDFLRENENYQITFFGRNDDMLENYKNFTKKNNLKNLNFKYYHPKEFQIIYEKYPVVIINSKFEGQSNSLMEALSQNSACIVNSRLRDEMLELYGKKFPDFIYFYKDEHELLKNLEFLSNQDNFEKIKNKLKIQNKFLDEYTDNNPTLSDIIFNH